MAANDEKETATRSDGGKEALFTLKVRRSHLVGLVVFLVGMLSGFGLFRLLDDDAIPVQFVTPPTELPGEGDPATSAGELSVPPAEVDVSVAGRPAIGPGDAEVTVVEFLDYQCPFCKRHFDEVLPRLLDEYEGRLRYVVRNYPLEAIHPFAMGAARAAECAHEQDRFFPYHDLLFENQDDLDRTDLLGYARELELDTDAFRKCVNDPESATRVDKDVEDARSYGVTGTPTFFINGTRLAGLQSFESFSATIEAALEEDGN